MIKKKTKTAKLNVTRVLKKVPELTPSDACGLILIAKYKDRFNQQMTTKKKCQVDFEAIMKTLSPEATRIAIAMINFSKEQLKTAHALVEKWQYL